MGSVKWGRGGGITAEGRTDDEGDHGCAVTTSGLEALDELLHLPYLDLYGNKRISQPGLHTAHSLGTRGKRRGSVKLCKMTTHVLLGLVLLSVRHLEVGEINELENKMKGTRSRDGEGFVVVVARFSRCVRCDAVLRGKKT